MTLMIIFILGTWNGWKYLWAITPTCRDVKRVAVDFFFETTHIYMQATFPENSETVNDQIKRLPRDIHNILWKQSIVIRRNSEQFFMILLITELGHANFRSPE